MITIRGFKKRKHLGFYRSRTGTARAYRPVYAYGGREYTSVLVHYTRMYEYVITYNTHAYAIHMGGVHEHNVQHVQLPRLILDDENVV